MRRLPLRAYKLTGGLLALLLATGSLDAEPANRDASADGAAASAPSAEAQPVSSEEQSPVSKKKWEFATIGYAWFAGAKGQTDVAKALPPADLDLSFGDVLKIGRPVER